MRVVFAPAALRDLQAIGDYIAVENRSRARTFVAELRAACTSLSSEAQRYAPQPQWPDIRRMPVGNYLVLYQALEDAVRIVRVVHSARDLDALQL